MNTMTTDINTIGEYAGLVYNTLKSNGAMSEDEVLKQLPDMKPADVFQGIGWLAREDKLEVEADETGTTNYALQDEERSDEEQ